MEKKEEEAASLLSYSKSFGFRLKRAFFKHPQYITELFSYKFIKRKEASDLKCPAGGTDL